MNFIKRYPRISCILLGFGLGMVVAVSNGYYANATITEYKSIVAERESRYEGLLEKSQTEIESLSKINENLKQRITTKKVTNPDGTIVEETDTDTDRNTTSEVEVRQTIKIEYERKLQVETSKYKEEINKIINRKLRIGVGYNSNFDYYGHGAYNIYGPISIGGGVVSDGTIMIDIGITL